MISLLIYVIIILIVFGVIFWAVRDYAPIPQPFKNVILCLVILVMCLILLGVVGIIPGWPTRPALT